MAAIGVIIAAAFFMDHRAKTALAIAERNGDRAVQIASKGFLDGRTAVYLVCSQEGQTRIVTKTYFQAREFLRPGAHSKGGFHLSAWERRGRADIQVSVPMTITAMGGLDTMESDTLDSSAVASIVEGLRNPTLDFLSVHGFEHGFFFTRSGVADLRPLERCLPK